jgi:hypothetical protein
MDKHYISGTRRAMRARILHHQGRALQGIWTQMTRWMTVSWRWGMGRTWPHHKNITLEEKSSPITSEQRRYWGQYGWMNDLWGSLKSLGNSTCASSLQGGRGQLTTCMLGLQVLVWDSTCCPWGITQLGVPPKQGEATAWGQGLPTWDVETRNKLLYEADDPARCL